MSDNRDMALVLKLVADQFQSELKRQEGALSNFNSFITNWKTQLVAAGAALFGIAKSTANYGDELRKTSEKIGVGVEDLAGLQHAAQLADLDNQQLAKGLKFLSQNMVEATRHTGDGEALFRRLGVAATNATGQLGPTAEVLLDVAEAFANAEDNAGRTEMAVKLFGMAGMDLIPFLLQGKAGIKELMAEAKRLGLVMSDENTVAMEKFNDNLKKLEGTVKGFSVIVGTELVKAFSDLLEAVEGMDGSSAAENMVEWIRVIRFGFKDLVISVAEFNAQAVVLGGSILDIFSEEKAKALGARLDRIHTMAEELREAAAADIAGVPKVAEPTNLGERKQLREGKTDLSSTGVTKGETEALKARHAAKQQAVKNDLELVKLGFAREQAMVDAMVADGKVSHVQAAQDRNRIRENELTTMAGNIQRQMIVEEQGHAERRRLGMENKEAEDKEAAEHAKVMADLTQQQKVLNAQMVNEQLAGEAAVRAAQSQTTKEHLDLLIQGANAIHADTEKSQGEITDLARAWVAYDAQVGASNELRAQHMTDVIAAELAQITNLTTEEMRTLMTAWEEHESEKAEMILAKTSLTMAERERLEIQTLTKIDQRNEATSDSVVAGWNRGMRRYVEDTRGALGMGVDMARRAAQMMEQGFQQFFFDVMDGKIKSFKDVMASLADFVKQIVSQMIAQLAAAAATRALVMAGLALNTGGKVPVKANAGGTIGGFTPMQQFAFGGPVVGFGNQDTVPALLTPGEVVLARKDVDDIKRTYRNVAISPGSPAGPTSPETNIIINNYGKQEVTTQEERGGDGKRMIYVTIREAVRRGIANGDMDKAMNGRFRLSPRGGS